MAGQKRFDRDPAFREAQRRADGVSHVVPLRATPSCAQRSSSRISGSGSCVQASSTWSRVSPMDCVRVLRKLRTRVPGRNQQRERNRNLQPDRGPARPWGSRASVRVRAPACTAGNNSGRDTCRSGTRASNSMAASAIDRRKQEDPPVDLETACRPNRPAPAWPARVTSSRGSRAAMPAADTQSRSQAEQAEQQDSPSEIGAQARFERAPKRQAQSHLGTARQRAGQQQMRYIHGRQQHYRRHDRKQHQSTGAGVGHAIAEIAYRARAAVVIRGRIGGRPAFRKHRNLLIDLRDAVARRKPAEEVEPAQTWSNCALRSTPPRSRPPSINRGPCRCRLRGNWPAARPTHRPCCDVSLPRISVICWPTILGSPANSRFQNAYPSSTPGWVRSVAASAGMKARPRIGFTPRSRKEVRRDHIGQQQGRCAVGARHDAAAAPERHHALQRRGALRDLLVLGVGKEAVGVLRRGREHAHQLARHAARAWDGASAHPSGRRWPSSPRCPAPASAPRSP